jgi:transposase
MQRQNTKPDFSNQTIFIGIDVHKKSWNVSIFTSDIHIKTFNQPPDSESLSRYLHRNYPGARYCAVYEAGYFGYGIHDSLRQKGIECILANPLDVPAKDKERRHKSDRIDSLKLGRALRSNEIEALYVPPPQYRYARTLIRSRSQIMKKQTRCKNQIKGLLGFYGYSLHADCPYSHWSRAFIQWLQELELQDRSIRISLDLLIDELLHLRKSLLYVTRQIRDLSRTPLFCDDVRLLLSVPGIGVLAAMILLSEIITIARFSSLDKLATYVGLIPTCHDSGEKESDGSMTHRGNHFLKYILIEAAWVAVRHDPALLEKFQKLSHRMKKQRAIISVAKNLLNRIRYVLRHKQVYVPAIAA